MGSGKCPLRVICSASLVMLLRATQTTKPKICLGPKVYKDFHEIEKGSSNSTCHLFVHRESLLSKGICKADVVLFPQFWVDCAMWSALLTKWCQCEGGVIEHSWVNIPDWDLGHSDPLRLNYLVTPYLDYVPFTQSFSRAVQTQNLNYIIYPHVIFLYHDEILKAKEK
jgi:hypothetical protein